MDEQGTEKTSQRLRALADRIDDVESQLGDPDVIPFLGGKIPPVTHEQAIPYPSGEVPPAVGVGAAGTKKGVYALADHTHDGVPSGAGTWIDVVTGVSLDEYGLHIQMTAIKVLDTAAASPESYTIDVTDCPEES